MTASPTADYISPSSGGNPASNHTNHLHNGQRTSSSSSNQRLDNPEPSTKKLSSNKHRSLGPPGQKLKLLRKGREKHGKSLEAEDDEEWTFEGGPSTGSTIALGDENDDSMEELTSLSGSQEKGNYMNQVSGEDKGKRPKMRGIVKKTSRLFSRDKDKTEKDNIGGGPSTPSLVNSNNGRHSSYSSATSNESAITSGSSLRQQHPPLSRPQSSNNKSRSPKSSYSRRMSQGSQNSFQSFPPVAVSESATTAKSNARPTTNLSASVPTLPRNTFQASAPPGINRNPETIPSRMSTWFSSLIPSSSTATISETQQSSLAPNTTTSSSPARKAPSAAAHFLYAARQRAVDGMRNLLDSEAQPDRCPDTIWVMGVDHPGWSPTTPVESPVFSFSELPSSDGPQRRSSGSSGKPSPPPKHGTLRPAVWPKKKDPTSPPPKSFGNLFSSSTLSLSLPTSPPSKEGESRLAASDSPGKQSKTKKEKEVLRWPEQFYDDFRSTVWCTYRSQYAPIVSLPDQLLIPTPQSYYSAFGPPADLDKPTQNTNHQASASLPLRPAASSWNWSRSAEERGLTTDAGWGCMLRTGQSMLANALIRLHLGRDWRTPDAVSSSDFTRDAEVMEDYATYVRILSWFFDDPSPLVPFGVHRMALIGKELGKEVGEWFGPSTAAGALKTLANSFPPCGLAVATATDSMIYKSDVYTASSRPCPGWFDDDSDYGKVNKLQHEKFRHWGDKAVLILVGLRLGLDGVNPIYHDSIKSVGIAGGRPSSSYYFIGSQANALFYLDPHFTRPAVPLEIPPAPSRRQKPPIHRTSKRSSSDVEEAEEGGPSLIQSPTRRESRPLSRPTVNIIDKGDFHSSSGASSPTRSGPWSRSSGQQTGFSIVTPETSPTRRRQPESPTTPLASAFSSVPSETTAIPSESSHPTPLARQPTQDSGTSQPALEIDPEVRWWANAYSESQLRSFHCEKVRKMPLSSLDPSMLLGFLCRDQAEFDDFCQRVARKIFTVQDEPPTWDDDDETGLESVSEPDLDDDDDEGASSTEDISHGRLNVDVDEGVSDDVETATTRAARSIETEAPELARKKEKAIQESGGDVGEEEGVGDDWVTAGPVTGPSNQLLSHPVAIQPIPDSPTYKHDKASDSETIPKPPKPKPLQNFIGDDSEMNLNSSSWIKPVTGGEEAPNGKSVL